MPNAKLIIIAGMSGTGKSTTAQNISYQYKMNGIKNDWYHEEMKDHPIRWANGGEFRAGGLNTEEGMRLNISDLYDRWKSLIEYMNSKGGVFVMDGCLDQNIIRYFMPAAYPAEKIIEFYDELFKIFIDEDTCIIHLYRPDVSASYYSAFKVRGEKWEQIITGGNKNFDFARISGYQELALNITSRYPGEKLLTDTSGGDWKSNIKEICGFLGLKYYERKYLSTINTEKYTGYYSCNDNGKTEGVNIISEAGELFCSPDWFTHIRMNATNKDEFELSAFPMVFKYSFDGNGAHITVSGNYDWGIAGKTLKRVR